MSWFFKSEEDEAKAIIEKISKLEEDLDEKLNPAHEEIVMDQASQSQYTSRYSNAHVNSYKTLEIVNRGVNMTADAVAEFSIDVKARLHGVTPVAKYNNAKRLNTLLNHRANPYLSAQEFKRQITIDMLLEGNAFVYWDGADLFVLPAINVQIVPDSKDFIKEYRYDRKTFQPDEIIHIRENASDSIFRGASRLNSAVASISILNRMNQYQDNFFKNNTILGVVLKTKDMLSPKIKQRKILEWMRDYNPTTGGRKPMILDGDFEIEDLAKYSFKELDFAQSIETQEKKIAEALGVPPILLDSGNNANIAPNLKLFYTNTVMPILDKIVASFELFFGFDLKPVTADIMALRPELREQSNYYGTLVNAGIMTRNEAREKLRLEPSTDEIADKLILPANIAGSAANSTVGGKPTDNNED